MLAIAEGLLTPAAPAARRPATPYARRFGNGTSMGTRAR